MHPLKRLLCYQRSPFVAVRQQNKLYDNRLSVDYLHRYNYAGIVILEAI